MKGCLLLALSAIALMGETSPFAAQSEGYFCYRAPAIAVTPKGTILVFAEGRVNSIKDEGDIDLVLKRSSDQGRTWSKQAILENDGANPCKNPSPVVLANGRVLLLWLWNKSISSERDRTTREVYVTYTDDEGVTWSKSRNITASVYEKDWRWYGIGPGHAIVKQRDPHRGRIVVPARHNARTTRMTSHIIYSDDGGETWKIGGSAPRQMTNESTVAELGNGDLMLNSRNGNKGSNECRAVSLSRDGGLTFGRFYIDPALIEPGNGCQGSLLNHSMNPTTGKSNILFSNPSHGEFRTNGTVKLSPDDGRTWTHGLRYSDPFPKFSGYSDMAVMPDGRIALVFERGDHYNKKQRYKEIGFRMLQLTDINNPLGEKSQ